jgi:hypothetical protein
MGAFCAMRDAASLHDMAEQAEVGEIEAHGDTFGFNEGRLRVFPIAGQVYAHHIS